MRPVTLVEACYKGIQTGLEELSEFLREVAALVLVFIPLDLWKNEITWTRSAEVFATSVFIFFLGLGCKGTAIAVKRVRDLYEEEQSRGSNDRS